MRVLPVELDEIMTNHLERRPAYKICIYDVRSTDDTIGDIVVGLELDEATGPWDITEHIEKVSAHEVSGNYSDNGVASSEMTFVVTDPDQQFDPTRVLIDPTADGRFFRSGNVVRVWLGDTRVAAADWPLVFTGQLFGQAGYITGRTVVNQQLQFKALSREAHFLKFTRTSEAYPNGTSYLNMAEDIAELQMGMDYDELDMAGWGSTVTAHRVVQLVEEPPVVMIAKLMFVDGFMPKFTGEGKLGKSAGFVSGVTHRLYENLDIFLDIQRPFAAIDTPNSVVVIGLDADLSRVDQPRQTLATMEVTTGFFTHNELIDVYWRDDKTLLADNVTAKVLQSTNAGLSGLGSDEEFDFIPPPNMITLGTIGCWVTIDTGYAPYIIIFLMVVYIVLSAIPDIGIGIGAITVIKVGSLIAAIALAAALFLMTKLGRGKYKFKGDPFEYVFAEIRSIARVEGTGEFDLNEMEIENHLVTNQTDGDNIAREMLLRQQALAHPRDVSMLHDIAIEPDDVFEIPGGRRFLIKSVDYTLVRGSEAQRASLKVVEITGGIAEAG